MMANKSGAIKTHCGMMMEGGGGDGQWGTEDGCHFRNLVRTPTGNNSIVRTKSMTTPISFSHLNSFHPSPAGVWLFQIYLALLPFTSFLHHIFYFQAKRSCAMETGWNG
jgi:hypothetical protein